MDFRIHLVNNNNNNSNKVIWAFSNKHKILLKLKINNSLLALNSKTKTFFKEMNSRTKDYLVVIYITKETYSILASEIHLYIYINIFLIL